MKPIILLFFLVAMSGLDQVRADDAIVAENPLAFASGSWFNPDRNYEGFVVQVISDEVAAVTWFTYPPDGEEGDQAWLSGAGSIVDNRIVIQDVLRPVGGTFGEDFDPADISRDHWGTLEFTAIDCETARVDYAGPPAFGSGSIDLVRLTGIDDIPCDGVPKIIPDRHVAGRSGLWSDPAHDGEGWMVEILDDGSMVVYWFTYDDQGRQAWLIGHGKVSGDTWWVDDVLITHGTAFGSAYDREDVVLENWGTLGFLFHDCEAAQIRYRSSDPRFGEGTLSPERLAFLAGTNCAEPEPEQPLTGGSWQLSAAMDVAITETASTALDGFVYTGGGYGHFDRLQRFDPLTESWQSLADLPEARHHPMMGSDGRYVYLAGGYRQQLGAEVPNSNFWRYDPASDNWLVLPGLVNPKGAGDVVFLNNRIFVVGGQGPGLQMQTWDPRTEAWELLDGDARAVADHMQAVVFENELWWMGGRTSDSTTNRVMIWNPVSREWREGPSMNWPRSGFAAAVVQGQIMVTGGERIDIQPAQLMPAMEIFAPGAEGWATGPEPPVLFHGSTGASANGEFIITGGSDEAGSLSENRATQIYTPAPP